MVKKYVRPLFILMLSACLIFILSAAGCGKAKEEKKAKKKKKPDNAYQEYVDTGVNTYKDAKELTGDIKEQGKKRDDMLLDENR